MSWRGIEVPLMPARKLVDQGMFFRYKRMIKLLTDDLPALLLAKQSNIRLRRSLKQSVSCSVDRSASDDLSQQLGHESRCRPFVVCVICYTPYAYPVTFIRAHIQLLPAKMVILYGGYFRAAGRGGSIVACNSEVHDKPLLPLTYYLTKRISRCFKSSANNRLETAVLTKFLVANKVDAVLAEFGPTGVAVMEACKEAQVPLIVHFHGNDAYAYPTLERSAYRNLFDQAVSVVAVSREMVERLHRLGAPEKKLHYNPCGVDTTLFQGGDPALAPPVFLAVGRLVSKKGPDLTLHAFSETAKKVPEARMVMLGNGSQWDACKKLARNLGIENRVDFQGVRSHAEVASVMKGVRALVQHSRTTTSGQSEGTPMTILEAGAAGIPVVATRHAGIPDVVIDGETGLLVDDGDVVGMAEHLTRLAMDPNLAARLGGAARNRICSEFSMEKRINYLWQIIKTAIEEK